jgi:hypothetical protein
MELAYPVVLAVVLAGILKQTPSAIEDDRPEVVIFRCSIGR